MIVDTVDGQSDHLHISFLELSTELGSSGQLCGADGGEVLRVRKENSPAAVEEVQETISLFHQHLGQHSTQGLEVRGIATGRFAGAVDTENLIICLINISDYQ